MPQFFQENTMAPFVKILFSLSFSVLETQILASNSKHKMFTKHSEHFVKPKTKNTPITH
jgi:hypothetical protein